MGSQNRDTALLVQIESPRAVQEATRIGAVPGVDGLRVLTWMRGSEVRSPVLILTAKDAVEDRVTGLESGADDYLVKPFEFAELVARVRALIRRKYETKSSIIKIGELEMPFAYKIFGEKPKDGRSLFISMHGGGGAPARVNDQQYENQKGLYKPEEGVYLLAEGRR